MDGTNQRQRAGDHGRGHRRPAGGEVTAVRPGAEDVLARGSEIDRPGAVIRVDGQTVAAVGGSNRDNVVIVVAGGITGTAIEVVALEVAAAVARSGNNDVPMLAGVGDGVGEGLIVRPLR